MVRGACTTTEIAAYVSACLSKAATPSSCSAWRGDGGACASCLTANLEPSPVWGPVICTAPSGTCGLNEGGCVDLVLGAADAGGGSCGAAITASNACENYVCGTCSTMADRQACVQQADSNECSMYFQQLVSTTGVCAALQPEAGPPLVAACFPTDDASDATFLSIFCGAGP